MLHVGTDEAGYGPVLGPLVIAGAVYEVKGARVPRGDRRVRDSKVVYRQGGRDALAEVLGPFLDLDAPVTLSALLERLSVAGDPRAAYAWYGDVSDPVPQPGRAPRSFRRILVNPVCERAFNRGSRGPGGKAGLLFVETMRIVKRALDSAPGHDADVVCDKHGGRNAYAALLMQEFVPSTLIAEREGAASSIYRMVCRGRRIRIRFVRRGEDADAAVALASMAAKYVRELFMESLNRFFASRIEGLKPTAGYYKDGRRFLGDVESELERLRVDRADLVRRC